MTESYKGQLGGARPGAGRKPGSGNRLSTQEKHVVDKVAESLPDIITNTSEYIITKVIDDIMAEDTELEKLTEMMDEALVHAMEASALAKEASEENSTTGNAKKAAETAEKYAKVIMMRRDIGEHKFEKLMEVLQALAKFRQQFNLQVNNVNNNVDLAGAFNITKAKDGDIIDG